ncbi:MAG: glycine cleavage system aminomethyltransferase GcvT [Pseudomonadales bacterium]|nr:glycine cleavage system aminomethyltransferase GcvT [Pseudomonadales bacterium]
MLKRTPLFEKHRQAGGRMVDFAGWEMPLNYGSQVSEHKQVRQHAGLFDVSHMSVIDIAGPQAQAYLRILLSNDVIRLDEPGRAMYTGMLNEKGGVMDDLIVYRMASGYRLVVNCATRQKDLEWLQKQADTFDVELQERPELAILAVHGPESIARVCALLEVSDADIVAGLRNFRAAQLGDRFIARTGYTGEKGLELILAPDDALCFWDCLVADGVSPIGLGARDSLRLEAGMNLYGHDMDETISPLAANMEQVVAWEPVERQFIGRQAVEQHKSMQQEGKLPMLTGIVLEDRGMLRQGQKVLTDKGEGVITSGGFSPTLGHAIALARIPLDSTTCQVEIRDKWVAARIVKPNFVRFGKKVE